MQPLQAKSWMTGHGLQDLQKELCQLECGDLGSAQLQLADLESQDFNKATL